MKKRVGKRVFWIDVLRVLALVLIVGFHFFYETSYNNDLRVFGLIGISLFFILSGFSLARKYPHHTEFHFRWFWHHFLKVAIPYYLALILIALLFSKQVYSGEIGDLLLHFFFLNFALEKTMYSIISPAWFLVPLIAFYALFPFFNREAKRSNHFLFLVFAISIIYRIIDGTFTSFSPLFFFAEFGFGIAFAHQRRRTALLISFLMLIVQPVMLAPFLIFYAFSFLKDSWKLFGGVIGFLAQQTIEIFLYHEAFIKVLFDRWHVYSMGQVFSFLLLFATTLLTFYFSRRCQHHFHGEFLVRFFRKEPRVN